MCFKLRHANQIFQNAHKIVLETKETSSILKEIKELRDRNYLHIDM